MAGDKGRNCLIREYKPTMGEHAPEQEAEGDRAEKRNDRPGNQRTSTSRTWVVLPNHVVTILL